MKQSEFLAQAASEIIEALDGSSHQEQALILDEMRGYARAAKDSELLEKCDSVYAGLNNSFSRVSFQ